MEKKKTKQISKQNKPRTGKKERKNVKKNDRNPDLSPAPSAVCDYTTKTDYITMVKTL